MSTEKYEQSTMRLGAVVTGTKIKESYTAKFLKIKSLIIENNYYDSSSETFKDFMKNLRSIQNFAVVTLNSNICFILIREYGLAPNKIVELLTDYTI